MRQADFLARQFPLAFRHVPVSWFQGVGVVRLGGDFVVEIVPDGFTLECPHEQYDFSRMYGRGWRGLEVRIVEHGVGEIARQFFSFEDYCEGRAPSGASEALKELHAKNVYEGLCVITWVYPPACSLEIELPAWEYLVPTNIQEEFLAPIENYVRAWI